MAEDLQASWRVADVSPLQKAKEAGASYFQVMAAARNTPAQAESSLQALAGLLFLLLLHRAPTVLNDTTHIQGLNSLAYIPVISRNTFRHIPVHTEGYFTNLPGVFQPSQVSSQD